MEPHLRTAVADALGVGVRSAVALSGGDVALAYCLELEDGRTVFAKSHLEPPPGFFITESTGLRWLAETNTVNVPAVLAVGDDPALLVLEWIEPGSASADTEEDLGRALAALHRAEAPCFGREDRRPTGSRQLPNDPAPSWAEFYAQRRLLPLARLAESAGALPGSSVSALRRVADRLGDLTGPTEEPSRLHGDLWGGNRIIDRRGRSWLIDPAVLGGHREFDLAMMRLFGGFGEAVFSAYAEVYPLARGWEERVTLCQLAPLVVHAIKFGGGYVSAASGAIARYD